MYSRGNAGKFTLEQILTDLPECKVRQVYHNSESDNFTRDQRKTSLP